MMKIRLRNEYLQFSHLNSHLDGYTILHISDIHFKTHMKNNEVLNSLTTQKADLVLITGDFIDSDHDILPVTEYAKNIQSLDGVFAVLGNHDYHYYTVLEHFIISKIRGIKKNNVQKLINLLENAGVKVLVNEAILLRTKNSKIFIEGTDDPTIRNAKITKKDENYLSSDFKILLSHSPDILYSPEIKKKKFDLILAGHTHGGQIRLPIIGPLATSTKHAKKDESFGLFKMENTFVNVSSGIGLSVFPIRINCPPEIVKITLCQN